MAKDVNKEKKTDKKVKSEKDKKSFAKDLKAELKKVSWPTPKQLVNNTTAVVVIVLITAVIVFVLDVVFETLNTYGVEKLKAVVTSTSETENTVDNNTVQETNTVEDANTAVENTTTENTVTDGNSVENTNTTNTASEEVKSNQ